MPTEDSLNLKYLSEVKGFSIFALDILNFFQLLQSYMEQGYGESRGVVEILRTNARSRRITIIEITQGRYVVLKKTDAVKLGLRHEGNLYYPASAAKKIEKISDFLSTPWKVHTDENGRRDYVLVIPYEIFMRQVRNPERISPVNRRKPPP